MSGSQKEDKKKTILESDVKPSISLHFVRHAESRNNEVYRDARYKFRGGTPDFDAEGWTRYVEANRKADPSLSTKGVEQSELLSRYLIPYIENQASHPIRIITSPMLRTLETIRPTLEGMQKLPGHRCRVHIIVCAFYHESEGCHNKEDPEEGMNPAQIRELLKESVQDPMRDIEFVGFEDPSRGWYIRGTGPETRKESEIRAAKFYLWFCEYLDRQLAIQDSDLFDAGVSIKGEEGEDEHDRHAKRIRRRRTAIMVGHGDFMSLVMKRLIAGYGHQVETEGISHRSAFAHFNTGISEFEYFGHGRFLAMGINHIPHIPFKKYRELRSGGGLKDGWSYIMPADKFILDAEVSVAFSDEEVEGHVREQADALRALYLSSATSVAPENTLEVEQKGDETKQVQFVVKRGLQVVGVASYSESTGQLTDVAIRPTAASGTVGETLMDSVRQHARKLGRSSSLVVYPRSDESRELFESMGFSELDEKMVSPLE